MTHVAEECDLRDIKLGKLDLRVETLFKLIPFQEMPIDVRTRIEAAIMRPHALQHEVWVQDPAQHLNCEPLCSWWRWVKGAHHEGARFDHTPVDIKVLVNRKHFAHVPATLDNAWHRLAVLDMKGVFFFDLKCFNKSSIPSK